jgi:3-hydroxyisobutyrate dehydrogenase
MRIGIMGIGLMGRAFAERYLAQGYAVGIYNRSAQTMSDLCEKGCKCYTGTRDLLQDHDTVILLAADAEAIYALLSLHEDTPALAEKTILQMATISPSQSRQIAARVSALGGRYLEAPVLGSLPEARNGSLIVMAGGDAALFAQLQPVLSVVGDSPRLIGEVGAASALKLAMNQLIAALTAGFSLSLAYARENSVDIGVFMDTVRASALYAPTYDKKLDKYLSRDFGAANFSTRHLLKDIRLFLNDADALGLDTGALEGIERITAQAVAGDLAGCDYSSIYQVIHPRGARNEGKGDA